MQALVALPRALTVCRWRSGRHNPLTWRRADSVAASGGSPLAILKAWGSRGNSEAFSLDARTPLTSSRVHCCSHSFPAPHIRLIRSPRSFRIIPNTKMKFSTFTLACLVASPSVLATLCILGIKDPLIPCPKNEPTLIDLGSHKDTTTAKNTPTTTAKQENSQKTKPVEAPPAQTPTTTAAWTEPADTYTPTTIATTTSTPSTTSTTSESEDYTSTTFAISILSVTPEPVATTSATHTTSTSATPSVAQFTPGPNAAGALGASLTLALGAVVAIGGIMA